MRVAAAHCFCFLLVSICAFGAPQPAIQPRFLLVVDTSASMGRKLPMNLKTVRALVRSGFNGQIEQGDWFALWTIRDVLQTNFFPAQQWVQRENKLLAEVAALAIETEPHQGRSSPVIFSQLLPSTRTTNCAAIIFLSDEPLKGTPFDRELSAYYNAHSLQILRERKAYVTAISLADGKPVSMKISMTGGTAEMPPAAARQARNDSALPLTAPVALEPLSEPVVLEPKPILPEQAPVQRADVAPPKTVAPLVSPKPKAEAIADLPSFVITPAPEIAIIRPVPSKEAQVTPRPVEDSPEQVIPPAAKESEAAHKLAAPTTSFFAFANIAYLAAGFVLLGWIFWRIFERRLPRDSRSLITRSMDAK